MTDTKRNARGNEFVLASLRQLAGSLEPGARLPTVRELVVRYQVSQHAVQTALTTLSAEGLIQTFVGRGTFVAGAGASETAGPSRSVLTLLNQTEYERGDVIGQLVHQRLLAGGHRSLMLTYGNADDAISMLRDAPRYDACILQPRASMVPVRLLGMLRERSNNVLIEMRVVDLLDVDAISNDPVVATDLILDHLTKLGHRRIAWVVEQRDDHFYEVTIPLFLSYRRWNGRTADETPVIRLPKPKQGFGFEDLALGLKPLFDRGPDKAPTALVLLTFDSASRILAAMDRLGLSVPRDVSLVRIGSPDLEKDHGNLVATVGRPTTQAADVVIQRLEWRWANPDEPFGTHYDKPRLVPFSSTAVPRGDRT